MNAGWVMLHRKLLENPLARRPVCRHFWVHLLGLRKPVYVWSLSKQSDPDYMSACAKHMRTRFEQIYGGRWITVRTDRASNDSPETPRRAWNPIPVDPLPGGTAQSENLNS